MFKGTSGNFFSSYHSDLALRNCYLTTDLTVKVGDYGIGPTSFKVKLEKASLFLIFVFIFYLTLLLHYFFSLSLQEDYITTEDDQCVALRWLAPELIGELHGGLITSEQTKPSNVW